MDRVLPMNTLRALEKLVIKEYRPNGLGAPASLLRDDRGFLMVIEEAHV